MKKVLMSLAILLTSTSSFGGTIFIKHARGISGTARIIDVRDNRFTIDVYYRWKDQDGPSKAALNKRDLVDQGITLNSEELKVKLVEENGYLIVDTQNSTPNERRIITFLEEESFFEEVSFFERLKNLVFEQIVPDKAMNF